MFHDPLLAEPYWVQIGETALFLFFWLKFVGPLGWLKQAGWTEMWLMMAVKICVLELLLLCCGAWCCRCRADRAVVF